MSVTTLPGLHVCTSSYLPCGLLPVKQVFPSFDFLGWYSVGAVPTPQDIELHKQVGICNAGTLLYLSIQLILPFLPLVVLHLQ